MKFIELSSQTAFQDAIESIGSTNHIVVCGSEEDKQYIEDGMKDSTQTVDQIITDSKQIDIHAWFSERKDKLEQDVEKDLTELLGYWPAEPEPQQGFSLTFDMLSGKPHEDLVGAAIETDASWKVPAHFKFGGWDETPAPALHCAIWKYWQQKYGAEIVGVSNDVIEAYITNPPKTNEEAIQLAWEQYLYCNDIVDHGVDTISNLSASIINHSSWYFWWD